MYMLIYTLEVKHTQEHNTLQNNTLNIKPGIANINSIVCLPYFLTPVQTQDLMFRQRRIRRRKFAASPENYFTKLQQSGTIVSGVF